GRQVKQQFKSGQYLRSAVTAAALLDPFATGAVVSANQAIDEGRTREAIGSAAVDVLTLWGGKKLGGAPDSTVRMNKLISGTGLQMRDIERVLPEVTDEAHRAGRPQTVGDLKDIIDGGSGKLQAEFNRDFDPIKNRTAYTPAIKNHIDRIIRENPQWA